MDEAVEMRSRALLVWAGLYARATWGREVLAFAYRTLLLVPFSAL